MWKTDVALIGHRGHCCQPLGLARMSGDEDKLVLARCRKAPVQKVLDPRRPPLFVDAEEIHVEVVAGVLEVIGVAAEKRDLLLGSKHNAHVRVAAVPVDVVLAPLVQADDLAQQAGFFCRFGLDFRRHRVEGGRRLFGRHLGLEDGLHAGRHILDAHQHVELKSLAADLLIARLGIEAVPVVVVVFVPKSGQNVGSHVLVGHDQPIGRNERSRAPLVEADTRLLEMLEPIGGRLEVIPGVELPQGGPVKEPQSLVAKGPAGDKEGARAPRTTAIRVDCRRDDTLVGWPIVQSTR